MPSVPDDPVVALRSALGGKHEPYPWQIRLLRMMCRGELPRALDLPTGLGKTAVLPIWLVARMYAPERLPRRLVYIVDRRAVVDQASGVAAALRAWSAQEPFRDALGLSGPLPVSTLRGQFLDRHEWLADPSSPAIIVGTVDMIGSRLLFGGYGVSRKMRPFHAGLLGCDTLFVLDESHLVPPFERLIEGARAPSLWPDREGPAGQPLRLLSLSATGGFDGETFRLDGDDLADPRVAQRTSAKKRLISSDLDEKGDLAAALASAAWGLAKGDPPRRVVVFSSSRAVAESARDHLLKIAKSDSESGSAPPDTELLVGARRLRERLLAGARIESLGFFSSAERSPPARSTFLFATAAGEVGVDLDADHAVMDVVSWERMVQRLGRVNRAGAGDATIVIIAQTGAKWLAPVCDLLSKLPEVEGGRDGAPAALGQLVADFPDEVAAASTPEPLFPPLELPVVEAWAMTSLRDHTGRPEVAPWLRGWVDVEPQTIVVWRSSVPATVDFADYFEALPPHLSERLEMSTPLVAAWLVDRAVKVIKARDAEARPFDDDVVAVRLDGAGDVESSYTLKTLADADKRFKDKLVRELSGRTVVVDAAIGGLSDTGLLDAKADAPPPTLDGAGVWLDAGSEAGPAVPFRARIAAAGSLAPADGWSEAARFPWRAQPDVDPANYLVVETFGAASTTEDSRSSGPRQLLAEHASWTEAEARRLAVRLGLSSALAEVVTVAARLHDEGKRAERWQRAFSAPEGGPYAKTRGPIRHKLLDGYRHELGSLPLAERDPGFQRLDPDQRELVLHLIAAHHGGARPTINTSGCDDAPPSRVVERARDVALRFVALQERLGPWRLAWLESVVRAADQTASRRNAQEVK